MRTKDNIILSVVKEHKIPFKRVPFQIRFERKCFSVAKAYKLNQALISFLFQNQKLNLKIKNKFVIEFPHFKMENYKFVKDIITCSCFMAIIDLKVAYCMIPVPIELKNTNKFIYTMWCVGKVMILKIELPGEFRERSEAGLLLLGYQVSVQILIGLDHSIQHRVSAFTQFR
ncbi:hypothetical protein ABEB36_003008 [Hypothenemus hampei]|uniref:Uncharacterized protein n=1 Tax=Hypothenemus hampei TaxID=57062 RepID=A0ABD1F9K4_HYPHA